MSTLLRASWYISKRHVRGKHDMCISVSQLLLRLPHTLYAPTVQGPRQHTA